MSVSCRWAVSARSGGAAYLLRSAIAVAPGVSRFLFLGIPGVLDNRCCQYKTGRTGKKTTIKRKGSLPDCGTGIGRTALVRIRSLSSKRGISITSPDGEASAPSPTRLRRIQIENWMIGQGPELSGDRPQLSAGPGTADPFADAASMCRDEDEVRQIVRQLGLTEYSGKRTGAL